MRLSRPVKIVLGVLTAVPPLYVVGFAALIAWTLYLRVSGDPHADALPVPLSTLMAFHLGVMVLIAALLTFYMRYLFRSGRVPPEDRARWTFALLVVNVAAMPIFFLVHVWPDRPPE